MMKRRVFGMLLSLCLVLMLIPSMAFAEDAAQILTVPYTTTVKQGGSVAPGETVFTLKLMDSMGKDAGLNNVNVSGRTVTTDGEGDYDGMLTFTLSYGDLTKLGDGVFVQQVDEGKDGWDYDPTVWYVKPSQVAARAAQGDSEASYVVLISPVNYEDTGDGNKFYIPTENWQDGMAFTNTYTKSAPEETPKPEETTGPNDDTSAPDVTALPKTGDDSSLTLWLALLAVSAAAAAGAVVLRRKSARAK